MFNFFLRSPLGRIIVHALLSSYEVVMNLMPDIILVYAEGKTVDWISILTTPSFWITLIANIVYFCIFEEIKSKDRKVIEFYTQEHVQQYINETTNIALEQMRSGKHRLAKKQYNYKNDISEKSEESLQIKSQ